MSTQAFEQPEWQPAILIHAGHAKRKDPFSAKWINDKPERAFARIRPVKLKMEITCDSDCVFQVHPDDVARITGTNENNGIEIIVCEHEILTD